MDRKFLAPQAATTDIIQFLVRIAGNPRKAAIKLDFKNAHNRVHRGDSLRQLRRLLPMLSPWMEFTYGQHSKLIFGKDVVPSQQGGQQGDPLAGVAWSAGFKEIEPGICRKPH